MFVDVCFPKNNEEKFIDIASKLNTEGLCFVQDKAKPKIKSDLKIFVGTHNDKGKQDIFFSPLKRNISKKKKEHYFYSKYERGTYHVPVKSVNQVVFKELVEKNKLLLLPFSPFLKKRGIVKTYSFIVKLCKKYNNKVVLCSFAETPYELRSKYELQSFGKLIGMDTKMIKKSVRNLGDFLS